MSTQKHRKTRELRNAREEQRTSGVAVLHTKHRFCGANYLVDATAVVLCTAQDSRFSNLRASSSFLLLTLLLVAPIDMFLDRSPVVACHAAGASPLHCSFRNLCRQEVYRRHGQYINTPGHVQLGRK